MTKEITSLGGACKETNGQQSLFFWPLVAGPAAADRARPKPQSRNGAT
jgi:hypothetical protein